MKFIFSTLAVIHQRKEFACGVQVLDEYLKFRASQDVKHGYATIIIMSPYENPEQIVGFYTLSAASINLDTLPGNKAAKLPRYPQIPAIRIGRVAVNKNFQGRGLGRLLILNAIKRCCESNIAWVFLIVEAKDERAKNFYEKMFFSSFINNRLHMWMKRKQAQKISTLLGG